ncbi:hypothetical protein [Enhygromyxa salina]|nr:hypothetical protein [Enhygromyxa salina]
MSANRGRYPREDDELPIDPENVVFLAEEMRVCWVRAKLAELERLHLTTGQSREVLKMWISRDKAACPYTLVATWATFAVGDLLFPRALPPLPTLEGCAGADALTQANLALLSDSSSRASTGSSRPGHLYRIKSLEKALATRHLDAALDLTTTPDHPLAAGVLARAWAPLVLSWCRRHPEEPVWEVASLGARRPGGKLVWDRRTPPPSLDHDPAEPRGFDAIVVSDSAVDVYYYLGVNWRSDLSFDNGDGAFGFLEHVEADWQQALPSLDAETLEAIQGARDRGNLTHWVVHDSKRAKSSAEATAAAAAHFGLKLRSADLMKA